jgi:hypothetical protein
MVYHWVVRWGERKVVPMVALMGERRVAQLEHSMVAMKAA